MFVSCRRQDGEVPPIADGAEVEPYAFYAEIARQFVEADLAYCVVLVTGGLLKLTYSVQADDVHCFQVLLGDLDGEPGLQRNPAM